MSNDNKPQIGEQWFKHHEDCTRLYTVIAHLGGTMWYAYVVERNTLRGTITYKADVTEEEMGELACPLEIPTYRYADEVILEEEPEIGTIATLASGERYKRDDFGRWRSPGVTKPWEYIKPRAVAYTKMVEVPL